jgi:subfamily B ATP-binding cassette protein MsbA
LYLSKFFEPAGDLTTTTNAIAQAAVGVDRIRAILDTDAVIPEKATAADPPPFDRSCSASIKGRDNV